MDASLYAPSGNPCAYLLGNALCYIISGMMLLVVGVIITSLTFQVRRDRTTILFLSTLPVCLFAQHGRRHGGLN